MFGCLVMPTVMTIKLHSLSSLLRRDVVESCHNVIEASVHIVRVGLFG